MPCPRPLLEKYSTKRLTVVSSDFIFNLMVNHSSEHLDTVFSALSDSTRRAMLKALSTQASTIGELAAPYDISLAAASKHIKVLERAGLVKRTVQGRVHHCELDVRPMHAGLEWMRHYEQWWNRKLDVLEELLKQEDAATAKQPKARATKRAPSTKKANRSKP
jgi:DNA-binding transcriptional ArsR family regulator